MVTQRELQAYLAQQVYENAVDIAPELIDYIGGSTREEIDASIAQVKASTAALVSSTWSQQNVQEGTRASYEAQLAAQINAMSAEEFAAYRQTISIGRSKKDVGIFGR